jgi:hypothetical protein
MIKLVDLLKEDKYKDEFLPKEQEIFKAKPTYSEYITKMVPLLKSFSADKGALHLYNHHAAEIAWEENKTNEAKKHIDIAMKNNKFGNAITHVLDFIINSKGTKDQLKTEIERITDTQEKKTATELLNDPVYGGKLK